MKKGLKLTLYTVMLIQALLAFVWIIMCGISSPVIREEGEYLSVAFENVTADEYTGLLYPVFLSITNNAEGTLLITAILQLLVLAAGIFMLLSACCKKAGFCERILLCVAVLSCPFIIQSAFSLTPHALCLGLFLMWLSFSAFNTCKQNKIQKILAELLPICTILLWKVYVYVYAISALVLLVINLKNKNKDIKALRRFLITIGELVLAFVIFMFTVTPGANNKMPNSMSTGLMNTYAFEAFESDYYFWPEEAKQLIAFENVKSMINGKDEAIFVMGNYFSDMSYIERDKTGLLIAKGSLFNRSRESIDRFIGNGIEYVLFPYTVIKNLDGDGKSLTAYRYFDMSGNTPLYAGVYIRLWFILMCVFASVSLLCFKRADANMIVFALMLTLLLGFFMGSFALTYFDYFLMLPAAAVMGAMLCSYAVKETKTKKAD